MGVPRLDHLSTGGGTGMRRMWKAFGKWKRSAGSSRAGAEDGVRPGGRLRADRSRLRAGPSVRRCSPTRARRRRLRVPKAIGDFLVLRASARAAARHSRCPTPTWSATCASWERWKGFPPPLRRRGIDCAQGSGRAGGREATDTVVSQHRRRVEISRTCWRNRWRGRLTSRPYNCHRIPSANSHSQVNLLGSWELGVGNWFVGN